MDTQDLRVDVTDEDIRASRRLWLAAQDDDDVSADRTDQLHDDLRRLIHAQAQQLAEEFRAKHRAARQAAVDDLRAARRRAVDDPSVAQRPPADEEASAMAAAPQTAAAPRVTPASGR